MLDQYQGKKILITGGVGFIGSNLARKLLHLGAKVTLVDSMIPDYGGNFANIDDIKDKLWFSATDVRDVHAMRHLIKGQDYLFNMAGQTSHLDSMKDPFTDLEINTAAQLSILESVRKYNPGIRIVFASTRQLYGIPQYLPVDEKHPTVPVDVNGINKLSGERYHLLYGENYDIACTCLRLTNTYGPGMRVRDARQTFLGVWVKNLLCGGEIQVFGDGSQLRDFNYVSDVVEAFLLSGIKDEAVGNVMNLGSDEVLSLEKLAAILVEIVGDGGYSIVPFPEERKRIDIGDYYSDWSLARNVLGWNPQVMLLAGLEKTLGYYRRHGNEYWD